VLQNPLSHHKEVAGLENEDGQGREIKLVSKKPKTEWKDSQRLGR